MDIASKKIYIGDINVLELLGVQDANISVLKKKFPGKIVVRGDEIQIKGSKEEIELIEKIILLLKEKIKKEGKLESQEVEELLYRETFSSERLLYSELHLVLQMHRKRSCLSCMQEGQSL